MAREGSEAELFQLAFELSASGMLVADHGQTIRLANRELERLLGYPPGTLAGTPVSRLLPEDAVSPIARAALEGAPDDRTSRHPIELLHRDGTRVPVEAAVHRIAQDGEVLVLASFVDVSAREREKQRFQIAVESAPSGMIMTDERGTILLVNREVERLFGYPREALIGTPIERLVPERMRGRHPGHRSAFYRHPEIRPMGAGRELFGLRSDGTEVPIEIGLNPIHTDEGMCVLSSIVEITERRRIEEQFRQAQKMEAIGTLAGGIAHDFNNILFSIMGYTQLVQARAPKEEKLQSDLDQVLTAAERGRQLVQRILMFSRGRQVERGRIPLERPVREALHLLRASLPSTIEIRTSIERDTPEVTADETEMVQIIMNLATNSAHAMPEGGVLEVRLGPYEMTPGFAREHGGLVSGHYARLTVRDTGAGMSEQVARRAFEPFFTTKPAGTGSGLGLSVIHGIVRAQRGTIELHSRPGEGTRIDIYLPASDLAQKEDTRVEEASSMPATRHVMVVEDEQNLATMLKRQVEEMGLTVTVHTSSPEALEDFRSRPADFQLLITDNTMPRMTGLALTAEVLRIRPDLPVMLISGLAETADPEDMRARGIRKLLHKPHRWHELAEAIKELIGG